jgi:hypothetical protein
MSPNPVCLAVLVLIQQKRVVSQGRVGMRDIWGPIATGSVACSLAPWGLMSNIGSRSSVSGRKRQFLRPLGAHKQVSFGGQGLLGILINSLVGLMDYRAVSWQRGFFGRGEGNRLLPINLPVASLLSASMAPGIRPVGQQLSAGLLFPTQQMVLTG